MINPQLLSLQNTHNPKQEKPTLPYTVLNSSLDKTIKGATSGNGYETKFETLCFYLKLTHLSAGGSSEEL